LAPRSLFGLSNNIKLGVALCYGKIATIGNLAIFESTTGLNIFG
jgi:hypothetical protein